MKVVHVLVKMYKVKQQTNGLCLRNRPKFHSNEKAGNKQSIIICA